MWSRVARGEVALALLFAVLGGVWFVRALGLPLWEGFAPNSGFMPLIYGALLLALSGTALVRFLLRETGGGVPEEPIGKPLLLLAALLAAVVGVQIAGFALSVFLMLAFMFAVVERRPLPLSLIVAFGTTAVLILIFHGWLDVPLPKGPLGF
jgi:hypothetical protein